jgi:hypothetical protein
MKQQQGTLAISIQHHYHAASLLLPFKKEQPPVAENLSPRNFYYYPAANVYYDPTRHHYIFLDSTAKTWKESNELPDSIKNSLDKNVVLNNITPPVWKNNEQHRMVYAASLYANATDFKEKPVKKEPVPDKDTAEKKEDQQKEKGIKGFFKKLFKKKKEDK